MNEHSQWEPVVFEASSAAMESLVLKTSRELARCSGYDIVDVLSQSIAALHSTDLRQDAGWFFLGRSAELINALPCPPTERAPHSLSRLVQAGLGWCAAELRKGEPILLGVQREPAESTPPYGKQLHEAGAKSIAILPSGDFAGQQTVLILISTGREIDWNERLVGQCNLLHATFCNAWLRQNASSQIERSLSSLRGVLRDANSGAAFFDGYGRVTWANPALHQMLGYQKTRLRGLSLASILVTNGHSRDATGRRRRHGDLVGECELLHKGDYTIQAKVASKGIVCGPQGAQVSLLLAEDSTHGGALEQRELTVRNLVNRLIQSGEDERKHLSRELHDDIGQRLSLAASAIAVLASEEAADPTVQQGRLSAVGEELDQLCTDIHELSHRLHSSKLEHLGLKVAITDLCQGISRPSFKVTLHADVLREPKSPRTSLCLYRIVQEGLNNALKHSGAQNVAVTMARVQEKFFLSIQDGGVGFEEGTVPWGLGLTSMRERVSLTGGEFRIQSRPGRGTEIWVEVPDINEAKVDDPKKLAFLGNPGDGRRRPSA
ncbi:MAG TPA: ATP-binding protein [Acidobacteriaceae bacterium]